MGTITDKLRNILHSKANIASAISLKGVDCDPRGILREYPQKIMNIPSVESDTPAVGDIRQEGIVAYVDPENPARFLLMSKDEFKLAWRTGSNATQEINGLTLDNGLANSKIIWESTEYNNNPDEFPIFKTAKEYKANSGEWFVPSRKELDLAFESILNYTREDQLANPDKVPDYTTLNKLNRLLDFSGYPQISTTAEYWVSSQKQQNTLFLGEVNSIPTFIDNTIAGEDPTIALPVRFFKWVEPTKKTEGYNGYVKDSAWPDFYKEMKADTEPFQYKVFAVLLDIANDVVSPAYCDLFVTSDGQRYENSTPDATVTHRFDTTKDLTDSKGQHIRWVKCYSNQAEFPTEFRYYPKGAIYVVINFDLSRDFVGDTFTPECLEVIGNLNNLREFAIGHNTKMFRADNVIDDCWYPEPPFLFYLHNQGSDRQTIGLQYPSKAVFSDSSNSSLAYGPGNTFKDITMDLNMGKNNELFQGDLQKAEIVRNGPHLYSSYMSNSAIFVNCPNLKEIYLETSSDYRVPVIDQLLDNTNNWGTGSLSLTKIKIGPYPYGRNVNFNIRFAPNLTVSCLIDILNSLVDRSRQSPAYNLLLGESNLAKLSDEEKLIATNKNWTVSA